MSKRLNIVKSKDQKFLPRRLEKQHIENLEEVDRMHDQWLKGLAQKVTPWWAKLAVKWFGWQWVVRRYTLTVKDSTANSITDRIYKRRLEVFLRGKLIARNWTAA